MTSETKPPRRRIILKSIAALILAFIAYRIIWWATGTPAPKVDYLAKIQELAASYQPSEGENGWPLLVEAAEMMKDLADNEKVKALLDERVEAIGDPYYWPIARTLDFYSLREDPLLIQYCQPEYKALEILHAQGAFDLLNQALAKPRLISDVHTSPENPQITSNVLLPHLMTFQKLSRARVASMRVAIERGEMDEWCRAFQQSLGLANACSMQFSLIERLVGHAQTRMILMELNAELLENPIDRTTLNRLTKILDRQISRPPISLPLEWERMYGLDLINWCFTDNGHGDGRLQAKRFNDLSMADINSGNEAEVNPFQAFVHEGRKDTTRRLQDFYDRLLEHIIKSPMERKSSPFDDMAFVDSFPDNQLFLRWVLVPVSKVAREDDALATFTAGTRLLIAIKTYESSHGVYPESLDDLVPEILDQPILDPANNQPFINHLIEDGSGQPRVILYSMGVDGEDDSAGINFSDPVAVDTIGHSVWETGTDMLITRPRENSTLWELMKELEEEEEEGAAE